MMRHLIIISAIAFSLYANDSTIELFKSSKDNELLCKISANSYKIVSQKNSSLVIINNTHFFKLKKENGKSPKKGKS